MFVKDFMTRHPVMVDPEMSVIEAQGIMAEAEVSHLPVVEEGKRLAGLITRSTLRIPPSSLGSLNVWEISRYLARMKVKDVMIKRRDVIAVTPDVTLEEAAQIMASHRVDCLPVVEGQEPGRAFVVGFITATDMMVRLAELLGAGGRGVRVAIRVPNRQGEFAKITSAIASHGWGIYASGGVAAPKHPGFWDCVVKVRNVPADQLVDVLKQIEGHEILDVREET
jgi:acetoin utilization protein AcuB